MKRIVFISMLLVVCPALAQDRKADLKNGARVNPEKPTVYLQYVCHDKHRAYLRIYNNTIWNLMIVTDELYYPTKKRIELLNGVKTYAAPNDKEISLHYRIEPWSVSPDKVAMPKVSYADNGFTSWIASEDSIQFSVPVAYLRKDLQLVVYFQYEWEVVKATYSNDPEHRITFRGIDLPTANGANCRVPDSARPER